MLNIVWTHFQCSASFKRRRCLICWLMNGACRVWSAPQILPYICLEHLSGAYTVRVYFAYECIIPYEIILMVHTTVPSGTPDNEACSAAWSSVSQTLKKSPKRRSRPSGAFTFTLSGCLSGWLSSLIFRIWNSDRPVLSEDADVVLMRPQSYRKNQERLSGCSFH